MIHVESGFGVRVRRSSKQRSQRGARGVGELERLMGSLIES
jgi:hypothetical protein